MKVASRYGVAALLVFALALMVLPSVKATGATWNRMTRVTFNNSVQLPGVVLSPGDYRFQLLDSYTTRHVVQVFNADHSQIYGTWFTIPVERAQVTGKTVFVMEERPYGEPEAIKQWFYPGEYAGEEFIYGKEKSTAVAAVTSTEVVTPEVTPAPEQPAAVEEPAPAAQPESSPAVTQEPQYQEPAKQAEPEKKAEPAKEEELPQTASNLYLVLLIGSITVLSGAALRRFAKS